MFLLQFRAANVIPKLCVFGLHLTAQSLSQPSTGVQAKRDDTVLSQDLLPLSQFSLLNAFFMLLESGINLGSYLINLPIAEEIILLYYEPSLNKIPAPTILG